MRNHRSGRIVVDEFSLGNKQLCPTNFSLSWWRLGNVGSLQALMFHASEFTRNDKLKFVGLQSVLSA